MIIILLLFLGTAKECFTYIQAGNIQLAHRTFKTLSLKDTEHDKYVSAYFSRNSKQAVETFESLYKSSSDPQVKRASKQKLYEYYYAKGLYQRAQQYEIEHHENKHTTATKESDYYTIQMGVYSAESNALALKQKIRKITTHNVSLKRELRDGLRVIVVNVGKFPQKQSALKELDRLHDGLGLSGWVKQLNN